MKVICKRCKEISDELSSKLTTDGDWYHHQCFDNENADRSYAGLPALKLTTKTTAEDKVIARLDEYLMLEFAIFATLTILKALFGKQAVAILEAWKETFSDRQGRTPIMNKLAAHEQIMIESRVDIVIERITNVISK